MTATERQYDMKKSPATAAAGVWLRWLGCKELENLSIQTETAAEDQIF